MADSVSLPADKPVHTAKLVLLGDAAVGKSSLVTRFVGNTFSENKEPTIGAAFLTQKCSLKDRMIKFEIWDTAGQERFASLAPMYYRNAHAALVVYDLLNPASFVKARTWIAELNREAPPNIVIALVGNKLDKLEDQKDQARRNRAEANSVQENPRGDSEGHRSGRDGEDDGHGRGTEGSDDDDDDEPFDEMGDGSILTKPIKMKHAAQYAKQGGFVYFQTSAKTGENVAQVFEAIAARIPVGDLKTHKAVGVGGNGDDHGGVSNRVSLNHPGQNSGAEGCAC